MNETTDQIKTKDIQFYWDSFKNEKLMIQRCKECGSFRFYPGTFCTNCLSSEIEWKEASGNGTVHSFSIVYRPLSKEFSPDVPYVVALIDLDEGVRMMSNIIECPLDEIHIGMKVQVIYEESHDGKVIPKFRSIVIPGSK